MKPYAWPFVVLGGLTAVALAVAGSMWTVEVGLCTLAFVGLTRLSNGHDPSERVGPILAYAFALWFYWGVERWIPALGRPSWDGALLAADQAMLGSTPSTWFALTPWQADLLSCAYFAYLPYLHGVMLLALLAPTTERQALANRLFPAFAVGYLGYLLVPAAGPLVHDGLFAEPLQGGWLTRTNASLMAAGSPGFDVFPSLHVLITGVVWLHEWRFHRTRALVALPVVGLLVVATVALRYHYAIDLLAALGLLAILEAWARAQAGGGRRSRYSRSNR